MEKKKWVKLAGFAMVFLLSLFFCVGCSEEVKDSLVTVSFGSGDEQQSRVLRARYENIHDPNEAYWTFTAVKKSGTHTTGASEKDAYGKLIETPVNVGKGFHGFSRQFSSGVWDFTVFGYKDESHTGLIYKGTKTGVNLSTATTVYFEINPVKAADGGCYPEKGTLAIDTVSVRVPENMNLPVDSIVKAELYDGDVLVAHSHNVLTFSRSAGQLLALNTFVFENGKQEFSEGIHTLRCEVSVHDYTGVYEDSTNMIKIKIVPICFLIQAGKITELTGNLDDRTLKPVGGKIFCVNGSGFWAGDTQVPASPTNVFYNFYDKNGTLLTTHTVAGLSTAVCYERFGTPICVKDSSTYGKFWVYDTTNGPIKDIMWGGYGTDPDTTWTYANNYAGEFFRDKLFGAANHVVPSAFEPLLHSLTGGTANADDGQYNTIWSYLDYVNCYGNLRNYPASETWGVQAPGGCTDWHIPTARELVCLGSYVGFCAGGSAKATGGSYGSTWQSSAPVPTDPLKLEIYNWFKNNNVLSSNQSQNNKDTQVNLFVKSYGMTFNNATYTKNNKYSVILLRTF